MIVPAPVRGAPEAAAAAKADEPPVWRMEDEEPHDYETEPARYRHLARQRRRIASFQPLRLNSRRKITVRAFLSAERP